MFYFSICLYYYYFIFIIKKIKTVVIIFLSKPLSLLFYISFHNNISFQGILSNVTISGTTIEDWLHTGYPLSDISQIEKLPKPHSKVSPPAFYTAKFKLPDNMTSPLDTFVDMTGWGKVSDLNKINYLNTLTCCFRNLQLTLHF